MSDEVAFEPAQAGRIADSATVQSTSVANVSTAPRSQSLPTCARGEFRDANVDGSTIAGGRVYRNESISYELPDAHPVENTRPFHPMVELGRRITMRVQPQGPARFLIERGGPDGGFAWFDVP